MDFSRSAQHNNLSTQKLTNMQDTLFETPAQTTSQAAQGMFNQSPTAIPSHENRINIFNLVYPNGGGCPAQTVFHEDPGHGWLQVPHSLLRSLKIEKKITRHSYRDTNYAYLEEDCDLSAFMRALGIDPGSELQKEFWRHCPQEFKENTPIRNKKHY